MLSFSPYFLFPPSRSNFKSFFEQFLSAGGGVSSKNISSPPLHPPSSLSTAAEANLNYGQWRSVAVCCSVLQCVAVCCSVLQCVAVNYGQWRSPPTHVTRCNTPQHAATNCTHAGTHCNALKCSSVSLQRTVEHSNALKMRTNARCSSFTLFLHKSPIYVGLLCQKEP